MSVSKLTAAIEGAYRETNPAMRQSPLRQIVIGVKEIGDRTRRR